MAQLNTLSPLKVSHTVTHVLHLLAWEEWRHDCAILPESPTQKIHLFSTTAQGFYLHASSRESATMFGKFRIGNGHRKERWGITQPPPRQLIAVHVQHCPDVVSDSWNSDDDFGHDIWPTGLQSPICLNCINVPETKHLTLCRENNK